MAGMRKDSKSSSRAWLHVLGATAVVTQTARTRVRWDAILMMLASSNVWANVVARCVSVVCVVIVDLACRLEVLDMSNVR